MERGTIEVAFEATEEFTNPMGNLLGAFLAAMLYDTVGPALLAILNPDQFQSTLDFNVRFFRPVRPGRIVGKAGSFTATLTLPMSKRPSPTPTMRRSRSRPQQPR